MMLRRFAILLCLSLFLGACGDKEQPSPPKPLSEPAAPAPRALPPSEPAPAPDVSPEPVAKPAAPAKPVEPVVKDKGETRAATEAPPKNVVRKEPPRPVVQPPLQAENVDLHLPREFLVEMMSGTPDEQVPDKALLPPMFAEKSSESPFQLSGKLLQKERARTGDDYWDSVEGAEVQFEFKH